MAAGHIPAMALVSFICHGIVAVCCNTSEIKTGFDNPSKAASRPRTPILSAAL